MSKFGLPPFKWTLNGVNGIPGLLEKGLQDSFLSCLNSFIVGWGRGGILCFWGKIGGWEIAPLCFSFPCLYHMSSLKNVLAANVMAQLVPTLGFFVHCLIGRQGILMFSCYC